MGYSRFLSFRENYSGEELRKLIDDAQQNHFEVRVLPNYRQLIDGNLIVQPRPVSIEDLLQRKPVKLDIDDIRKWVDGQVGPGYRQRRQHRLGNLPAITAILAQADSGGGSL